MTDLLSTHVLCDAQDDNDEHDEDNASGYQREHLNFHSFSFLYTVFHRQFPDRGSLADDENTARVNLNGSREDANSPSLAPNEPNNPNAPLAREPVLDDIRIAHAFINSLKSATLDNGFLDQKSIHRLRNPKRGELVLDDIDERLSIKLYLALGNASQDANNKSPRCDLEHRTWSQNYCLTIRSKDGSLN